MAPFLREPSIASSATLGRSTRRRLQAPTPSSSRATAGSEDVCMTDVEKRRFIIGVDYGTAYSSASYAVVYGDSRELGRSDIRHITNFDDDPFDQDRYSSPSKDVASVVWYPDEEVRNADPLSYDTAEERMAHIQIDHQETSWPVEEDEESVAYIGENGEHTNQQMKSPPYSRNTPDTVRWGFGAQPSSRLSNASEFLSKRNSPIQWAKLQLADGKFRAGYSQKSQKSFYALRSSSVVTKELDFITDFLTCFFKHIKKELREKEDLLDDEPVEMVLCVPVCWSCKARRKMYDAMSMAMKQSGLGADCIDDMYMVHEPEAAAAYFLGEESDIMINDVFVLLDIGGGTGDATTYKVTDTMPLRLEREVVEPHGELCGSTYLNDDFRAFVKEKLKDEKYLTAPQTQLGENLTLDDLIEERVMKVFENMVKRKMDFGNSNAAKFVFDIPGLRPDAVKGFYSWKLPVYRDEFFKIFEPRMNEVADLMERQINECRKKNVSVDKVVLMGGFGDNKALRAHLKTRLNQIQDQHGQAIPLWTAPEFGSFATAVSAGAVLRAFNKELSPSRTLQSSYGLRRKELHDRTIEGHNRGTTFWDKLDGTRYVKNTILWEFTKGDNVQGRPERVIPTEHTFPIDSPCIVEEHFFVSDVLTESHWQTDSSKNKGKYESAGTFTINLEPWRNQGWIQRQPAGTGKHGLEHWAVQYDIIMRIDGCLMRCSARYPSIESEEWKTGRVRPVEIPGSRIDVNIIAAFEPGKG